MAMTGERVVSAPGRTRPRGFAPWAPRAAAQMMMKHIQAVLIEYQEFLPLSVRSIFYRLVGAHGLDKTEAAASQVYDVVNRARRAGLIKFESISDGGGRAASWSTGPTLRIFSAT